MQFSILTTKTESFYTACSPELELICYGQCQDEAVNNLQDSMRQREQAQGSNAVRSEDRPMHCPVCRRGFRSHGSLKRHMAEHASPRQCRNCGKRLQENEYHRC